MVARRGFSLLGGWIAFLVVRDVQRLLGTPSLRTVSNADHTNVSVLVPARNEAHRIGPLLEGLGNQESRCFDVVVLDDHSSDGTGDIVRGWDAQGRQVQVIPGRPLPAGWSGKCWACWQAARVGDAPWLLFLDADTAPEPGLISSLVAHAEEYRLDLLTLIPLVETHTFWERVLIPPFGMLIGIVFPPAKVNAPESTIAMANGPCILVRRTVYEATGGHATVRSSILEDVELGQLVKRAGYRIEIAAAPQLLRVRLYTSLADISEGLQKNAWAGYGAGGWRSAWSGIRQMVMSLAPISLLVAGLLRRHTPTGQAALRWGGFLTTATLGVWGWYMRRAHHLHPLWGLVYPAGAVGYFVLAGRAWLDLRRGKGVAWKGRSYGISTLS